MSSLYMDGVPATWAKRAWPTKRSLTAWLANWTLRLNQLEEWTGNPMSLPKVTWVSGFVNPQAFLTAILQVGQMCVRVCVCVPARACVSLNVCVCKTMADDE